jgi:CRP-like cAMP-binding protein
VHLFPTLTPQQISRIAASGRRRSTTRGEVLVDVGDRVAPFFVILSGAIQALRPFVGAEALNATLRTGQFSGEGALMTGRRSMAQLRVSEPGQVLQRA